MTAATQAELTYLIARGERKRAASLLVRDHAAAVFALCRAIVRDPRLAEDLSQDVFMHAFGALTRFRGESSPRTWLLRIATNKALLVRRSRARVVPITEAAELTGPDSTDPSATRLAILAAVGELPTGMRAAVVLRYYADLPVEEVARALGKSPNTVKSQLRVALARMRTSFARRTGQEGRRDVV